MRKANSPGLPRRHLCFPILFPQESPSALEHCRAFHQLSYTVFQSRVPSPAPHLLSWNVLSSSLVFRYNTGYQISSARIWVSDGIQQFRPESFSFGANPSLKSAPDAKNPWSITVNAGLTQNLLRFSESSLAVGLTSKISIGKDFSVSFSGSSQNFFRLALLHRTFQSLGYIQSGGLPEKFLHRHRRVTVGLGSSSAEAESVQIEDACDQPAAESP